MLNKSHQGKGSFNPYIMMGCDSSAVIHVFLHVSLRSGKEGSDPTF